MKIEFTKDKIIKKYKVKYGERFLLHNNPEVKSTQELNFDMIYNGRKISLMTYPKENNEALGYIKSLEEANKIFDTVEYRLGNSGIPIEISNLFEIRERWDKIRKTMNPDDDEMLTDLIFSMTGIIEDDEGVLDLAQRYCIIPYLFTGFHNREIGPREQFRTNGMVYNIFPLSDIPVVYTLNSEIVDEDEKKINFIGKEDPDFDRFSYIKVVKNRLDEELNNLSRSFEMKINGYYIFSSDNTLKKMNMDVEISITQLLNYKCKYFVTERDDDVEENIGEDNND